MHAAPISVLILYAHPLLGLGLARLLAAEPELSIVAIDAGDTDSIAEKLDAQPDVVIVEREDHARTTDLLELAPNAVVIDVGLGATPTRSYQPIEVAEPEGLVRAIRRARDMAAIRARSVTCTSAGGVVPASEEVGEPRDARHRTPTTG